MTNRKYAPRRETAEQLKELGVESASAAAGGILLSAPDAQGVVIMLRALARKMGAVAAAREAMKQVAKEAREA